MKKLFTFLAVSFSLVTLAQAQVQESKEYCDQKCSAEHCAQFPLRALDCKTACPDHFKACYDAVPEARKSQLDPALAEIEKSIQNN